MGIQITGSQPTPFITFEKRSLMKYSVAVSLFIPLLASVTARYLKKYKIMVNYEGCTKNLYCDSTVANSHFRKDT